MRIEYYLEMASNGFRIDDGLPSISKVDIHLKYRASKNKYLFTIKIMIMVHPEISILSLEEKKLQAFESIV